MVLESILTAEGVKKNPKSTFVLGIIYVAIAILVGYSIFPTDPSLAIIFLTTLAALPFLINVLYSEEEETMGFLKSNKPLPLIGTHVDVFLVFTYMFMGFLVCFLAVYIFSPHSINTMIFSEQIETIQSILGTGFVTGNVIKGTAMQTAANVEEGLKIILFNNIKVLMFSLLFSFLYGAGAIFILAWNASILAVAMGNLIKEKISQFGSLAGASLVAAYFQAGSFSVVRYFIHGIPEISAYFLGAVAGGIISAAVVNRDYRNPKFYEVLMDSVDLIALALLLLIIGSILEVAVTPMLIS